MIRRVLASVAFLAFVCSLRFGISVSAEPVLVLPAGKVFLDAGKFEEKLDEGDDNETLIKAPDVIRTKRSLIVPGTNWCGVGNVSADNYATGSISEPDRCCREHDHCPYTILGFTTKYNLFNHRFYTISHCECDDIFRTCLKMKNSESATIVGQLYFNYIGMKCFTFKKEQVCAERTWWGRCTREKTEWTAELRDPLEYS